MAYSTTYTDERGSSVPGEIIESWSYRLDNEDLYLPDGKIEISLPIGERQPLDDYSLLNHPEVYEEDGTLKLPEKVSPSRRERKSRPSEPYRFRMRLPSGSRWFRDSARPEGCVTAGFAGSVRSTQSRGAFASCTEA